MDRQKEIIDAQKKESVIGNKFTLWKVAFKQDVYKDQFGIERGGYIIQQELPVTVVDRYIEMQGSEEEQREVPVEVLITVTPDGKHYVKNGNWWYCKEDAEERERLVEPYKTEVKYGSVTIVGYNVPSEVQSRIDSVFDDSEIIDSSDYRSLLAFNPLLKKDGTPAVRPSNPNNPK